MEVTNGLKLSESVSRIGDSASMQAITRVNADGKLRPLGISTLCDRRCMTAAMLVLEPIFGAPGKLAR
jgi:hypothetical protein